MQLTAVRFDPAPTETITLDSPAWRRTTPVALTRCWNGEPAPPELATVARLGWDDSCLLIAFDCGYDQLDADTGADVDQTIERMGLWERDVCEAFIASPAEPHAESYKEFEVAPTGQSCDVAINRPRVDCDMRWNSGMTTAATIAVVARRWQALMRIPFAALGTTPARGDRWRANLFRIGRVQGVRRYMAYSPTLTSTPDFHVPHAFVPLVFV